MSSILNLKPNIGVYTDPQHNLWLDNADPSVEDIHSGASPGEGEVVVEIRSTGISGSDVQFWHAGRTGPMHLENEQILGHESAGEIIAVHSSVTRLKPGDRVAIEPETPCVTCEPCRRHFYLGCKRERVSFRSTPLIPGLLRRYIAHPAVFCHKLPPSLSFEDGALLEPLSVALAAVERSKLRRGDAVLICGAGPVGLTMLLCAREAGAGAHRLVITDLDAGRLAFAESLAPGRVRTLRVAPEEAPNELAARIAEAMGGTEPDVILECTGEEASIRAAIEVVRSGGAVFVVGIRKSEICYPVKRLLTRKVVLGQQYQYHNTFSEAIRLVEAGVLSDVRKLVTHRFPIEDAVRAFETSADPKSGAIKVQITNS